MQDFILDILDFIKFDLLGRSKPPLPAFDFNMRFKIRKNDKGFWLTSEEHPGFIASGKTLEELREAAFETILVYYDVPRYHSKRIKDLLSLNFPDGTVINPPEPIFAIKVRMA